MPVKGRPGPPPEAVLLRLVRQSRRVTVAQAAAAAEISKAWLSSIENGYDTRGREGIRPVRASAEIVASLAAFLQISPERLETEGQRPDAAAVLTEMLRGKQALNAEDSQMSAALASLPPSVRDPISRVPDREMRNALILAALVVEQTRSPQNGKQSA